MIKPIPAEGLTEKQRHRMIDLAASGPLKRREVDAELEELGLVRNYDAVEEPDAMEVNYENWTVNGNFTARFSRLVYGELCDSCREVKRLEADLAYVTKLDAETRLSSKPSLKSDGVKAKLAEARLVRCICK